MLPSAETLIQNFVKHYESLKDSGTFYVEGQRQEMERNTDRYEFRFNYTQNETDTDYELDCEVCILCQTSSTNVYALHKMFDRVTPLHQTFCTDLGCAQVGGTVKNRNFGRATASVPLLIGTSEATFKICFQKGT